MFFGETVKALFAPETSGVKQMSVHAFFFKNKGFISLKK